jgi:hypothetical protein
VDENSLAGFRSQGTNHPYHWETPALDIGMNLAPKRAT